MCSRHPGFVQMASSRWWKHLIMWYSEKKMPDARRRRHWWFEMCHPWWVCYRLIGVSFPHSYVLFLLTQQTPVSVCFMCLRESSSWARNRGKLLCTISALLELNTNCLYHWLWSFSVVWHWQEVKPPRFFFFFFFSLVLSALPVNLWDRGGGFDQLECYSAMFLRLDSHFVCMVCMHKNTHSCRHFTLFCWQSVVLMHSNMPQSISWGMKCI